LVPLVTRLSPSSFPPCIHVLETIFILCVMLVN
jgi:hypothetical protein